MALAGNFLDRVMQSTATTGTGAVTLGSAVLPYRTFAAAGAVDATVYWYLIEDGSTAWEVGYGTYTSSGTTLSRNLVASSTGSLLSLSGTATVACIAPARSMNFLGARVTKAADQTAANYTTEATVAWDSEVFDVGGWHDNVTDNSRLTVPSGYGINYVELTACVDTALGAADSWRLMYIRKNGTTTFGLHTFAEGGATLWGSTISSGPVSVVAGDYFEVRFSVETDTSITVNTNSFFAVKALG